MTSEADSKRASVLYERVMSMLDKQSGCRRPWRSTRFNNLYAVDDYETLSHQTSNYSFFFSGVYKFYKDSSDGNAVLNTIRLSVSVSTVDIYIRMFHCMVYLCSLSFKPWNAWLILNGDKDVDDTKRMQTFIRRYMTTLSETERVTFINNYVYDRGPMYDSASGHLVFLPVPKRDNDDEGTSVLTQLKKIIQSDEGPEHVEHSKYIIVPQILTFPDNSARNVTVSVESNVKWAFTGQDSDCRVSPESGANNGYVTVSVTENSATTERQWTLTVQDTDGQAESKTISVRQAGKVVIVPKLEVTPTSVEHDHTSDTSGVSLYLTATVAWTTNSADFPNWLQLNQTSGTGNKLLKVKFMTENSSDEDRTFTIVFSGEGVPDVSVSVKQKKSETGGNVLTVTPTELTGLSKDGATTGFTVRSNVAWVAASSNDTWCHINPVSGSATETEVETAVTVTVDPNPDPQRTATITVTGTDVTAKTVSVTQYGTAVQHHLTITPESLTRDHTAHSETFQYDSSDDWSGNSPVTWCWFGSGETSITGYAGKGTFVVSLAANDDGKATERTCTLQFTAGSITKQVSITQAAIPYIRVNPTSIANADSIGGDYHISIASNVAWAVNSSDTQICTVSPGSGSSGEGSVTITVSPNTTGAARSTTVVFSSAQMTDTVSIDVQQLANTSTVSVDKSWAEVVATDGTTTFKVIAASTVSWTVSADKEWLSFSPASGSGTQTVTVTAVNNTSTEGRDAQITVNDTGSSDSAGLQLHQMGYGEVKHINVSPMSIADVPAAGGNYRLTVESNVSWFLTGVTGVCSVSPGSGTGNATVDVTVEANSGTSPREFTLNFTSPELSEGLPSVSVSQYSEWMSTDPGDTPDIGWKVSPNYAYSNPLEASGHTSESIAIGIVYDVPSSFGTPALYGIYICNEETDIDGEQRQTEGSMINPSDVTFSPISGSSTGYTIYAVIQNNTVAKPKKIHLYVKLVNPNSGETEIRYINVYQKSGS